jgi:predicted lipid-binding transport protein (Tim44 family)
LRLILLKSLEEKTMKRLLIALFAVAVGAGLTLDTADAARRFGGGSSGMQRSQPIKREAAPQQNQNAAPAPARPAQSTAPATGGNRWLAPLAGLAAGIGLAALFSHLGLSETLATIVMLALIAAAAFFILRWILRRAFPQPARMQYAGASAAYGVHDRPEPSMAGSSAAAPGHGEWDVPDDFDADSFVRHAKLNFVRLQAANDARDLDDIRQFTTPELFAEIQQQMRQRADAPQQTEVLTLDAELLEVTAEFRQHIASVRFFGSLRETADGAPEAFDEIWHITRPIDGSGQWAIAGIQQSA